MSKGYTGRVSNLRSRGEDFVETRGRPKSEATIRIENSLKDKGVARAGFGERVGVSEVNARMRIYNAAKRKGLRVSTRRVDRGAVKYIEGVVVKPSKFRSR